MPRHLRLSIVNMPPRIDDQLNAMSLGEAFNFHSLFRWEGAATLSLVRERKKDPFVEAIQVLLSMPLLEM